MMIPCVARRSVTFTDGRHFFTFRYHTNCYHNHGATDLEEKTNKPCCAVEHPDECIERCYKRLMTRLTQ